MAKKIKKYPLEWHQSGIDGLTHYLETKRREFVRLQEELERGIPLLERRARRYKEALERGEVEYEVVE
jgi:hypothetical protein